MNVEIRLGANDDDNEFRKAVQEIIHDRPHSRRNSLLPAVRSIDVMAMGLAKSRQVKYGSVHLLYTVLYQCSGPSIIVGYTLDQWVIGGVG